MRGAGLVRGLAALALAVPCLTAQDPTDPRALRDPRETSDPRPMVDPREVDASGRPLDDPREPASGTDLITELLEVGDHGGIREAMRADPWNLLPYLDGYREEWLGMVESGQAATEAGRARLQESEATGRLLARLADEALDDTRFTAYVERAYAWTEDERAAFRRAQADYESGVALIDEALSLDEALRALGPFERSLATARELGDTWGRTMALAALARLQAVAGYTGEARAALEEALEFGYRIRDLDSVWDALETRLQLAVEEGDRTVAESALADQYLLAREVGDPAVAQTVLEQLEDLIGMFDDGTIPSGRLGLPPPTLGEAGPP